MSNGLLNGLAYYGMPVSGVYKDVVNNRTFTNENGVTFADNVDYPSGKSVVLDSSLFQRLLLADAASINLNDSVPFLMGIWATINLTGYNNGAVLATKASSNGNYVNAALDIENYQGAVSGYAGGGGINLANYNFLSSNFNGPAPNELVDVGEAYLLMFWYLGSTDKTLYMQIGNGGIHERGIDAFNATWTGEVADAGYPLILGSYNGDGLDYGFWDGSFGDSFLYKTTIPDATQRTLLAAGTPYADFDNGASGGVLRSGFQNLSGGTNS